MKFKNIGIILLILGFLFAIAYFVRTNSKSAIEYETTNPFISSIELTSVVTGKVIPEDEVEIKPQLNGIIEKNSCRGRRHCAKWSINCCN